MGNQDVGRVPPEPGSREPSPAVSALTGFNPSRKKLPKLRAWSVTEEDEGTGGIVFAKHGIVALKNGACQFGSGEWEYYKARRAPWADAFAETGDLPASVMVENGWHLECTGCGVRIDYDLPEMCRKYRGWTPDQIVGTQYAAWCTPRCHDEDMADRESRKRHEGLIADMMERLVKRRFPDATIIRDRERLTPHVYLQRDAHGFWRLGQAIVSFEFPGMKIAPANYRWDRITSYGDRKAHFTVCNDDKEAFEAYARETAQAIEARRAETAKTGSVEDESAVPEGCANHGAAA